MANAFYNSKIQVTVDTSVTGDTSARLSDSFRSEYNYDDAAGDAGQWEVFSLLNYDLLLADGNLDIDLFDLGTLDIGAGPGRDNLGNLWAQTKVLSITISNPASDLTGSVLIDQTALGSTAWTGLIGTSTLNLETGSWVQFNYGPAGRPITDVTDHMLRIAAVTADCVLNLHIVTSA